MHRALLAGLTANALLLASSLAAITWATADRPVGLGGPRFAATTSAPVIARPADEAPVAALAPALPAIPVAPVPPPEAVAIATPAQPTRRSSTGPSSRKPELSRTAEPMEAPRRKNLRDFRLELRAGVAELRQLVSACSVRGASFNLSVESFDGGVRVLNATVESPGDASPLDLACAEKALRGSVMPAMRAEAGRRQMPLTI